MEKGYVSVEVIEKLIKEFEQDIAYYENDGYEAWEHPLSSVQEKIELLELLIDMKEKK